MSLGFAGLVLVVWHKLGAGEVTPWNLALALLALLSITIGTLYQKRHVLPCDVRTASTVQLLGALVVSLPFALWETEGACSGTPISWWPWPGRCWCSRWGAVPCSIC